MNESNSELKPGYAICGMTHLDYGQQPIAALEVEDHNVRDTEFVWFKLQLGEIFTHDADKQVAVKKWLKERASYLAIYVNRAPTQIIKNEVKSVEALKVMVQGVPLELFDDRYRQLIFVGEGLNRLAVRLKPIEGS